jgi:cation transport ATPase
MIQRVQTVYLLLVAIASILLVFLPLFSIETDQVQLLAGSDFTAVAVLLTALAIDALVVIALFKKRKAQLALVLGMLFLTAVVLGLMVYYWNDLKNVNPDAAVSFEPAALLLLIIYLLLYLTRRAIKRDEDLVRSLDRLR